MMPSMIQASSRRFPVSNISPGEIRIGRFELTGHGCVRFGLSRYLTNQASFRASSAAELTEFSALRSGHTNDTRTFWCLTERQSSQHLV
jgi:hypothetical protein